MADTVAPLYHRHIYKCYQVKTKSCTKIYISPASSNPHPWCFPCCLQEMLLHVNDLKPGLREFAYKSHLSVDVIYTLVDVSQFQCLQIQTVKFQLVCSDPNSTWRRFQLSIQPSDSSPRMAPATPVVLMKGNRRLSCFTVSRADRTPYA